MNSTPSRLLILMTFLIAAVGLSFTQESSVAKVRVNVSPQEAYIFLNGHPYDHRSQTLALAPGEYTIGVYNYGYVPQVEKVTLKAGENPTIEARLKPIATRVSGPWGRIQIEGTPDDAAAVFLNGTTPDYFVGHVDEMNNQVWSAQQLIVPVGTYQMFIQNPREPNPFFSAKVEVRANERLIMNVAKDASTWKYVPWEGGTTAKELKRFDASTASATIAVAPVAGTLTLDKKQINCGQPVHLAWTSSEAADVEITANGQPMGKLPLSGDQMLQPKQTTTYEFRAMGPGGIVTSSATVDVNKTVQTSLSASPAEVRYQKSGDKVVKEASTKLNWTAQNADSVHIDPLGPVTGIRGSKPVILLPSKAGAGPVDEMKTYTITATNVCGGSDTSTASIHLTGDIGPGQVAEAQPPKLPQTASPLPLLGLLGAASLTLGFILHGIRK